MKLKGTIVFVFFAAAAMVGFFFFKQGQEAKALEEAANAKTLEQQAKIEQDKLNSDSHRVKGNIKIGLDSYLGYYPLRSKKMSIKMLNSGYKMQFIDDAADYKARASKLASGELDMAVFTVDSFILNGAPKFPGKIIMVISESKGADALVTKKEISKINDLTSVSATLDSPSHHLIKTSIIDFGLDELKSNIKSANGSEDALSHLLDGQVDGAVLWEPDVSKAIQDPRFKILLSTENTSKLIVDILVASDRVINEEPEKIVTFMQNYFPTLKDYQSNKESMASAFMADAKLSSEAANKIIDSIDWVNLQSNASTWFGIQSERNRMPKFDIIEAIQLTDDILQKFGDFSSSPLPNKDPFRLLNSRYISDLYQKQASGEKITGVDNGFRRLSLHQWNNLSPVATLKIQPITFRPGTAQLTDEAKEELLNIKNILSRYSRYRIRIEGHSSIQGDPELNKSLSKQRAEEIRKHFIETHQLHQNRILSIGEGAEKPLKRGENESYRAWLGRLPRVEFHLLEEIY